MIDVVSHNSLAWDKEVEAKSDWTRPVDEETIARARQGDWSVLLTPTRIVPRAWFGDLHGRHLLCLASGGGQQAPILAAAGAKVVSFDNSHRQLEQDRFVAERDSLDVRLEKGDSADLSRFPDDYFDLVFHPCSNCFMPELQPIWDECYRVLRKGGALLAGFTKPEVFIFDQVEREENRKLVVRHSLPYSDQTSLTEQELADKIADRHPLEFSHTLEEQLGGQTSAGFHIVGLYEDRWHVADAIDEYMPSFVATRAIKP